MLATPIFRTTVRRSRQNPAHGPEFRVVETFGQAPHVRVSAEDMRSRRLPSRSAPSTERKPFTVYAFLLSFGVIFVAELGDKSQLMAMTLATRYKPWPILAGITVATAGVHAVSVAVGAVA